MPAAANWSVRLPNDGKVSYRGVVGFDQAGTGGGAILYPAPGAVGLLVAVLTHGAIVESAKNAQKEKMQTDANMVLSSYQDALNSFDSRELMRRAADKASSPARARLLEPTEDPGQDMVIHSVPVFSMTQDQKAIVLDNTIGIQMPGAVATAAYQSTIRVVSAVKEVEDPLTFWTGNNGEKLKDESAQLVAESLGIALQEIAVSAKTESFPYRTVRYREGATEKMERAQVISTRCDRLLIRTLRGQLMSVPTALVSAQGCVTVASDSK
ncbi:MAG: hypothetical protein V4858_07145 [Pseudomonadota bacterium]